MTISVISVASAILLTIFIGVVYDVMGRKGPVLIFLVLMSISIILMPFLDEIFPGYVILRCFVVLSSTIVTTVPFAPDYV